MKRTTTMRLAIAVIAFCLPLIPNSTSAQQEIGRGTATTEQKPLVGYLVEFSVREIENGKRSNSRNYVMVVEDGSFGRIRVGNRVPISSPGGLGWEDVGMNIDCRPRGREDRVALEIGVESLSVVPPEQSTAPTPSQPTFRQQRSNTTSVVTLGKPTLVTGMDDVLSNRRYEIEVTATKVK